MDVDTLLASSPPLTHRRVRQPAACKMPRLLVSVCRRVRPTHHPVRTHLLHVCVSLQAPSPRALVHGAPGQAFIVGHLTLEGTLNQPCASPLRPASVLICAKAWGKFEGHFLEPIRWSMHWKLLEKHQPVHFMQHARRPAGRACCSHAMSVSVSTSTANHAPKSLLHKTASG